MSTTPRLPSAVEGRDADFGAILMHRPDVAVAFGTLYAEFWSNGPLDHPTRESARLRNARITDCGY